MRPRKAFAATLLALALLGALGLGIALKRADPSAMLERSLKRIAHRLPFEVESIEVRKTWRELLKGRLSTLAITLKWGAFRIHLAGPVQVRKDLKDNDLVVEYDPEFTIEPVGRQDKRSSPLDLHLWIESTRKLSELHAFGLSTQAARWKWDLFGTRLENFVAIVNWRENRIENRITLGALSYENPNGADPAIELKGLTLAQGTGLQLEPFGVGQNTTIQVDAKSADILWNRTLLSLPLEKFPVRLTAQFDPAAPSGSAQMSIGTLQLQGGLQGQNGEPKSASLHWSLPPLDLAHAAAEISTIAPQWAPWVQSMGIQAGRMRSEGSARADIPSKGRIPEVQGRLQLSGASFKPAALPLLLQGVEADVPFSTRKGIHGTLEAHRMAYKHLESSLGKTALTLTPSPDFKNFQLRIGDGKSLPLRVGDLPLSVGTLDGSVQLPSEFKIETSLALSPIETEKLTRPLCIKYNRIPPGRIEARFPRVEITHDSIDPTGQIRAELFDGVIEADEIGLFDLWSPVPELDFSAEMRGVRLEKIGQWLNFGEMKGSLEGYARDVTFQSWLPTRFDARIEVKPPADRARVVFSPVAVQNFVEVVAGSKLENIPSLVKWYAFGTPRYVFGGYDIDYAGVKLTSSDGIIELETLDPPEIYKKEKKHFILYGASIMDRVPVLGAVAWGGFRVPIQSPRYPVLMDATAIANYIRQLTERLSALSERSKKPEENQKNAESAEANDCSPQETVPEPKLPAPAALGISTRSLARLPDAQREHDPARSGRTARN